MSATKKQVGELENAIVILEERLEKLEEEHIMMKQMLSMQNALIDNLQMMVKMMSTNASTQAYQVGYVQLGGDEKSNNNNNSNAEKNETKESEQVQDGGSSSHHKKKFQHSLKTRMLRVV